MGNVESDQHDRAPSFEETLSEYQKREKLTDDRFGEVTAYNLTHSPQTLMIVKDIWVNTDRDSHQLSDFINSRISEYHKGLAT